MSHPRDPRHRRRHLQAAPPQQPRQVIHVPPLELEERPVVLDRGPADTSLLAGAVRAELLADDWRAAALATRHEAPEPVANLVGILSWDDIAAEAATEQGDEPDEWPAEISSPRQQDLKSVPQDDPTPTGLIDVSAHEWVTDVVHADGTESGEWVELEAVSDRDLGAGPGADEYGRVGDWSSRHDPRSLEFGVRTKLNARAPLQDRVWPHGPVFDQGMSPPLSLKDASGCTGYAFTAAVNICRPDLHLQAGDAFDLYLGAQKRDHVPGEAYAGTSVLAAAQEAQARGWIDAYLWCFGIGDVAQAVLQVGPVVLGLPWLTQMQVSPEGVLEPGGDRGGLGHAIACIGIVREHAGRPGPWFVLQQSYGQSAGVGGLLYISADNLRLLLRGVGEACVPIIAGKD
jgi:hypothetical protein